MTNQCSLTVEIVLVVKKEKQNNQKQTKNNQGKNIQIKNGNNSNYHEPLSKGWIGRRS